MICPNCKNEIKANAKFCNKCGFNLAEATVEEVKEQPSVSVCTKCGAELKPGAKFCTKCGTSTEAVPKPQVPKAKPASAEKQKQKSAPKAEAKVAKTEKKEKGNGLIVLLIVLIVLIAIAGIVGVLMWKEIIPIPTFSSKNTETTVGETDLDTASEISIETDSETAVEESESDIDVDELFAETDALVETAKDQMGEAAEIINAMDNLSSAVNEYVAKAEEAGNTALAADRVADAFDAYIEAVEKHKDMMNASTLSGAVYAQVMSELDAVAELGDELVEKGYEIDLSSIEQSRDEFDRSYRERIINTFDEFTTRDAWSRTEAWNLMKDTDSMYDSSDLDDAIRLRYVYALAWWTQKQIETELASGTITQKGAAIKIAGLIEAMDYNPMMINYYIQYMDTAGEDCSSVVTAYNEIVAHIKDTQGIEIGTDIDLAHFWYFNDVSEPADGVQDGTTNGVTQENREWIRSRMQYAGFVNQ